MSRAAIVVLVMLLASPAALANTVRSGSLRVDVGTAPLSLVFAAEGDAVLSSVTRGLELTDELLIRWVQLGAVSGVMRTQRDGITIGRPYQRPQVEEADQIDNWRRYTKLRTQLYPYIAAADREYDRSGLPIMRHLVLAYPDDATAIDREDEFLFGPDLLVAPVLTPGATTREAYLPVLQSEEREERGQRVCARSYGHRPVRDRVRPGRLARQ